MISVERVIEYSRISSEENGDVSQTSTTGASIDWSPSSGNIRFENVCLRYDDHIVLKNISVEIKSKEKV